MNAANEEAVYAFLDQRLSFGAIPDVVESTLEAHDSASDLTLDAVLATEEWARAEAQRRIEARA
jgi:1-deoxy-D-xylulose-5-phosphate reductoisomerase